MEVLLLCQMTNNLSSVFCLNKPAYVNQNHIKNQQTKRMENFLPSHDELLPILEADVSLLIPEPVVSFKKVRASRTI